MKKLLLICFFSSVSIFAFSQSTSKKQNTMKGHLQTSTSVPAQPVPAQPATDPAVQKQQKEAKLKAEELKKKKLAAASGTQKNQPVPADAMSLPQANEAAKQKAIRNN